MNPIDIFRIYWSGSHIGVDVNVWIILVFFIMAIVVFLIKAGSSFFDFFSPEIELSVPLGGLGSISIKADYSISQIAYTAWTELITRKAGLPIDIEHDVIAEVYNSWYQLFGKMRELIQTVPAPHLKKENTQKLVVLLIDTLNKGMRPHLTKWQAKFRRWYEAELLKEENKSKTPQEIQKMYPEYQALTKDLLLINGQMVEYAIQLKKLIKLDVEH